MTLQDIATFITTKLDKTDSSNVSLAKTLANQRYKMIYDSALWRDSLDIYATSVASGTDKIILPHWVDRVVAVRAGDSTSSGSEIEGVELQYLSRIDPEVFERNGTPVRWTEITPLGVSVLPSNQTIKAVSSSASDTTVSIRFTGQDSNSVQVTDTLTFSGTSVQTTTNTYNLVFTASKDTTVGTITVTNGTSGTTILTLGPTETERRHPRIRLHEIPNATFYFDILVKRKFQALVANLDAPILRGLDDALLSFTEGDMLERHRQYGKAQVKYQEAAAMMNKMREMEKNQSGIIMRITPVTSGEWERDDFE